MRRLYICNILNTFLRDLTILHSFGSCAKSLYGSSISEFWINVVVLNFLAVYVAWSLIEFILSLTIFMTFEVSGFCCEFVFIFSCFSFAFYSSLHLLSAFSFHTFFQIHWLSISYFVVFKDRPGIMDCFVPLIFSHAVKFLTLAFIFLIKWSVSCTEQHINITDFPPTHFRSYNDTDIIYLSSLKWSYDFSSFPFFVHSSHVHICNPKDLDKIYINQ